MSQKIPRLPDDDIKAALLEENAVIRDAHFAGASGAEIVQRRTALIDRLLRDSYGLLEASGPMPVLVAVGGYGRGELHPHSDIDMMFLCRDETERKRAPDLLYRLWDAGLDVGYSVRTIDDCVALARNDIKIRTSLLECRMIAGDRRLYGALMRALESDVLFWKPAAFIHEKLAERSETRRKYGGSLYLREPNIKEGTGGLRDIHTALWTAFAHFRITSLSDLVAKGVVTEGQYAVFLRSRNFLWRLRNEIHYLSNRKNDHLTFDLQEQAARDFHYRDSAHLLSVERFMKAYFIHARTIREFTGLVTASLLPKPSPGWFQRTQSFGPFKLIGKTLVSSERTLSGGIADVLASFRIVQSRRAVFSDALKAAVRAHRVGPDELSSPEASRIFLEILNDPHNLADTLTLMKDLRVLGRFIPEFRSIQALTRHDYYHMYAVDEHILLAIRNLEKLWSGTFPSLATLRDAFAGLRKRWPLILAVLIHDLGKVFRKDHENQGVLIAENVLGRLGVAGEDRDRILFLIGNHLVMSGLSQRRELSDRKVIADFARLVRDRENLAMLYLLTYADVSAVNPGAWTQWKASLLQDLYLKTLNHLDSSSLAAEEMQARLNSARDRIKKAAEACCPAGETEAFLASMPDQYILHAAPQRVVDHLLMVKRLPTEHLVLQYRHVPDKGYTELTICAYDAYGMFYRTAGTIAAKNLNILRAQVYTSRNGVMIDTFQITDSQGNLYAYDEAWESVLRELRLSLMTSRRPPEPGLYTSPRQVPGTVEPAVEFDNQTSDAFTIIDITARDMVGFLYRVTRTLFDLNLDIASAKIVTEGARVMDSFYVTDLLRKKVVDADRLEKIRATLLAAITEAQEAG